MRQRFYQALPTLTPTMVDALLRQVDRCGRYREWRIIVCADRVRIIE